MAKEEIIECLKSLSEKRMFSSEAEQFASPHKGKTLTLNIKVLESGRVFGRQVDSSYDDGHQLIAEIGDELKASIAERINASEELKEILRKATEAKKKQDSSYHQWRASD